MSDDRFNLEGYPDPVPHQALKNILEPKSLANKVFRPLVYVCSAYRGDTEVNIAKTRKYCRFVVEHGAIPVAPHLLLPQFMDDSNATERKLALFMDSVFITKCAEIWVFGKEITEGMKEDIKNARKAGKYFRYFNEDCTEQQEELWN